ncbi:MAG: hypothetical protein UR60_C0016G0018 [Candidatus Moranbacteria bacterium GW2011_GWF2_34_56]|nr:MAG: hypothetical protein UR51_C0009G0094 [Candidatus Moranbacteria bacterium GW2011_GWF1_34_10]KKP64744.1 MAG: hypothetical protein UR60_C0016G0018 [Candidatus Moranbacteria bacterium GW2011_GWF2_34_56]HBI17416.1 hypothetical protein [Candidatus Moranbacteria bacterium]
MEDQERSNIQDAQIVDEPGNANVKKGKKYHTEIILIFIIGLLLGIMIKAESLKKVSIGFSDYRVTGGSQGYDLNEIEKKMIEESKKQQESQEDLKVEESAPQEGVE